MCMLGCEEEEGRGGVSGGGRTLTVGRSTLTVVTSLPGFTSSVPGLEGSIDAGLWLSVKGNVNI